MINLCWAVNFNNKKKKTIHTTSLKCWTLSRVADLIHNDNQCISLVNLESIDRWLNILDQDYSEQ